MSVNREQLVANILKKLKVATPEKQIEVQRDVDSKADYILTKYDWNFLYSVKEITLIVNQPNYALPPDFLEAGSMWTNLGPIEITNDVWLRYHYPNLTSLSGHPLFAIFREQGKVALYPTTVAQNAFLNYRRKGVFNDLAAHDAFLEILTNAVLEANTPLNPSDPGYLPLVALKDRAFQRFLADLEALANRLARKHGHATSTVIPDPRDTDLRSIFKSKIWSNKYFSSS